jgi:hypothetical protein
MERLKGPTGRTERMRDLPKEIIGRPAAIVLDVRKTCGRDFERRPEPLQRDTGLLPETPDLPAKI